MMTKLKQNVKMNDLKWKKETNIVFYATHIFIQNNNMLNFEINL